MEGRSTGGELVTGTNEVSEPTALRGLHRLDDDVVVPLVRADLADAMEALILQGRSLRCSPAWKNVGIPRYGGRGLHFPGRR